MPRRFGRYLLLKKIAEGGMGEIFVARLRKGSSKRFFALKKLLPQFRTDEEFKSRFRDEARLVLAMRHPNIVRVHEVGCVGREWFMAMELVAGIDLGKLLCGWRDRRLPVSVALHITHQVLRALEYCHQQTDPCGNTLNLVHRDISPGNVLISFEGEVKIADFGLAASSLKVVRTRPHVLMGKPGYIAPERLMGGAVDARADLFNVGILLYELLTCRRYALSNEPSELLRELTERRDSKDFPMPAIVHDVLSTALAFSCHDRFQSAIEFRHAIEDLIEQIDPCFGADELAELVSDSLPTKPHGDRVATALCEHHTKKLERTQPTSLANNAATR